MVADRQWELRLSVLGQRVASLFAANQQVSAFRTESFGAKPWGGALDAGWRLRCG